MNVCDKEMSKIESLAQNLSDEMSQSFFYSHEDSFTRAHENEYESDFPNKTEYMTAKLHLQGKIRSVCVCCVA